MNIRCQLTMPSAWWPRLSARWPRPSARAPMCAFGRDHVTREVGFQCWHGTSVGSGGNIRARAAHERGARRCCSRLTGPLAQVESCCAGTCRSPARLLLEMNVTPPGSSTSEPRRPSTPTTTTTVWGDGTYKQHKYDNGQTDKQAARNQADAKRQPLKRTDAQTHKQANNRRSTQSALRRIGWLKRRLVDKSHGVPVLSAAFLPPFCTAILIHSQPN
jgi:hypothetical protein